MDGESEPVNPITFNGLDADAIRHAAHHTHGAAGPSGLDTYVWRDFALLSSLPQIVCVSHLLVWVVASLPPVSTLRVWVLLLLVV